MKNENRLFDHSPMCWRQHVHRGISQKNPKWRQNRNLLYIMVHNIRHRLQYHQMLTLTSLLNNHVCQKFPIKHSSPVNQEQLRRGQSSSEYLTGQLSTFSIEIGGIGPLMHEVIGRGHV